ncbi:hypothetical protein CDAR_479701 [Caerostris darwini]|uniref:Sm domain-containing protein n=1 Tax=Caerostris darwini TaxID=1538125 RepID=A0AAV4U4A7_9ARAC|nr:hypothetical protein CDAR_479701 [Caerostris darwini]
MSGYSSRRSEDDQRKHRRRRSSSGSRRSSSGSPEPRNENSLPTQFGKMEDHLEEEEGNNVLVRMREGFNHSPLGNLSPLLDDNVRIKVWTRNTKEVRGISTGSIVAFDKHWNLIMKNVHEVYFKPKKTKVPFLLDRKIGDKMPDLPPRVPKVKKEKNPEKAAQSAEDSAPIIEESASVAEESASVAEESVPVAEESAAKAEKAASKKEKKKKTKKKKNADEPNPHIITRSHAHLFIRGDNVVMVSILDTTSNGPDAEKSSDKD